MDAFFPKILEELDEQDCVILTADHGCDPTFRGTDHTREFAPLVAYSPGVKGATLGDRGSFGDIAASLLDAYGIPASELPSAGKSFLCKSKS